MSAPAHSPSLFPLFADLRDRLVLVVGAGAVAERKVTALLAADARVRVGAPSLSPALQALAKSDRIEILEGHFEPAWLDGAWLVFAATDDPLVNRAVAVAADARRIWANVADDAELSTFHLPARVRRGPLQLAISSGGGAPMLARHLRERFETQLDESLGTLATLLLRHRRRIRRALPDLVQRRRFFDRVLEGEGACRARQGDMPGAERALLAELASHSVAPRLGRVALVGAGPGDAGLLTLRALRLLNEADVILHDRLVSDEVLALSRRDAERIEVGKERGNHHVPQDRTNALLVEHARAGRIVVRLKGGDPFVFGRGGEELEALQAAGIPFEVVPGITAAVACGAYAGIPLTHRDHAQSVSLATAHGSGDADALDWAAFAQERTVALYMGVAELERVRARLLAHGRKPTTPVALVENGTRPEQRVLVGTLDGLVALARAHAVQSPAILIIGEVAALAARLHWFGAAPIGEPALRQTA